MSCMSQNLRLFHVSNLSVRNFRIFLLMYTGSSTEHSRGQTAPIPDPFIRTYTYLTLLRLLIHIACTTPSRSHGAMGANGRWPRLRYKVFRIPEKYIPDAGVCLWPVYCRVAPTSLPVWQVDLTGDVSCRSRTSVAGRGGRGSSRGPVRGVATNWQLITRPGLGGLFISGPATTIQTD